MRLFSDGFFLVPYHIKFIYSWNIVSEYLGCSCTHSFTSRLLIKNNFCVLSGKVSSSCWKFPGKWVSKSMLRMSCGCVATLPFYFLIQLISFLSLLQSNLFSLAVAINVSVLVHNCCQDCVFEVVMSFSYSFCILRSTSFYLSCERW